MDWLADIWNAGPAECEPGERSTVERSGRRREKGGRHPCPAALSGVPVPPLVFTQTELLDGSAGILIRLENKVAGLPDYQAQLLKTITGKKAVLAEVDNPRPDSAANP